MGKIKDKISSLLLKPLSAWYLSKERTYKHLGFTIKIPPTVFHPGLFFSTRYFLSFINELNLSHATICEAGCGSGILSLLCYRKGATVVALDINPTAVLATQRNFQTNFPNQLPTQSFHVYESDLFDKVPKKEFDFIFINPPYFFEDPTNAGESAWYCGKDGGYFEKLFSQLENHLSPTGIGYMILADNCEVGKIESISIRYGYKLRLIHHKKILWEKNYIFELARVNN